MNENEFKKIAFAITGFYPNLDFTAGQGYKALLWFEQLKDIDFEIVERNLKEHVASSKFPPTIADLRGSKAEKLLPYQERNDEYFIQLEEWKREAAANPTPAEKIAEMKARLFNK